MNIENELKRAGDLLSGMVTTSAVPESGRLDFYISSDNLRSAVQLFKTGGWGYLSAVTGQDLGKEDGKQEVLYHFCSGPAVITLRVQQSRDEGAVLPSISDIIPAAAFFEQELQEMLGYKMEGLKDSGRLFLPDDWPENVYPMRTDFDITQAAPVSIKPVQSSIPEKGNTFVVPIGPQHPALKEPGHFEFTVDGEIVTAARMRLGYAHRGIEKAAESRNWNQNLYLFERVCGICSHTHAMAYSIGVEKLAQVEIPERAQAIRELIAGLERVHSHLLWLGVAAHEAGFDTLFMYSWRDRETVMNLLEQLTGNRVNYSANVLGGVKCDVGPLQAEAVRTGLKYLETRIRHYLEVVTTDAVFLTRTRGVGTITYDEAVDYGILGPTARASGLVRDIRVEAPYGAYHKFPVSAITGKNGDLEARFVVRLEELLVSCFTMRTVVDNLPDGPLSVKVPRRIPAGETVSRVEAPRGELFYYIRSNGGETPARVHLRTPSLCNWVSVLEKAVGGQLADVPMLIAGMDPCFSCNDRMVTVVKRDNRQTWSWDQLRQYGIEYYQK